MFGHAKDLYGLIHARYILTSRGMVKMLQKYEDLEFGHCPNVACQNFPVLPVGLSNELRVELVKVFCPRCEQCYVPKSEPRAAAGCVVCCSLSARLFSPALRSLPPTPALLPTPLRVFSARGR